MTRSDIYILIGCEESQAVCLAFRKLGYNAFSCDIKESSGGSPEYHLKMDVLKAIKAGWLTTERGDKVYIKKWHAMICFPDCTFTCSSGLHWNGRVPGRAEKTEYALQFDCDLLNSGIQIIGMENPRGCISTRIFKYIGWFGDSKPEYKVFPKNISNGGFKPTQSIQPWQFGHPESKETCLWLINLPKLKPTEYADFNMYRCKCGYTFEADLGKYGCPNCAGEFVAKPMWDNQTKSGQNKLPPDGKNNKGRRAMLRSKTYSGIATAMAEQWGVHIIKYYNTKNYSIKQSCPYYDSANEYGCAKEHQCSCDAYKDQVYDK
jgi:hypothetical protein